MRLTVDQEQARGEKMIRRRDFRVVSGLAFVLMLVGLSSTIVSAQTKMQGTIDGRSGSQIFLRTADSPKVVVLLTDSTNVGQVQGVLKARSKSMSMAALIPGLPIQVEGSMNAEGQLVASKIRFKGDDLQQAEAIQAGMAETSAQAAQNAAELEKHNAELAAQNAQLTEQEKKIAANKASIAANSARFGQLNDYYILDEVTVLFGNGKTNVDPQYVPQLVALATKAKTINGYMIQVKGYASATGSAALNQKLSEDRANNVTSILLQKGDVPLTNMLAPGAMGESRQIEGGDKTADSEAANRRVVVRILQNKAIAGT
jgi:outer membrane protein OmpA-like peptidoglycan-associated protein